MNSVLKQLSLVPPYYSYFAELIVDRVRHRVVKPSEHLLRPGDVCDNIYFVEHGNLMVYSKINDNERRRFISDLFIEGDVCMMPESFFKGLPSTQFITAKNKSLIYYLPYHEVSYLQFSYPEFNIVLIMWLIDAITRSGRWHRMTMMQCDARVKMLFEESEMLLKAFPGRELAWFLGMTEVAYSRIISTIPKRRGDI